MKTIVKTIENQNIRTIVGFVSDQMDGGQVPASNSKELRDLAESVSAIQGHGSTLELRELGVRVLRAVIDRVSSNLAAEKALREFIQPGGGGDA